MIIDTDVMVWYARGDTNAGQAIDNGRIFNISVVTYIELVQGMRNKTELNNLRKALGNWKTKIIYISEEISMKAMIYVDNHYLSHSLQLADALIAATAVAFNLPILTGNIKHYKMINDIQLLEFNPSPDISG